MATHTREDLDKTLEVLEKVVKEFGLLRTSPSTVESLEQDSGVTKRFAKRNGNEVTEISSDDEIAESLRFSWKVYKDNSLWVPYFLVKERVNLLSGDYIYFRNNVITKRFIVKANGTLVGTASAFIDKRFLENWDESIGFIGFFEALPGHDEAISYLFDTASDFLQSQGVEEVWAPINVPFIFYGGGILTRGYDRKPSFLQPYNPEYYANYFERAGFHSLKLLPHYSIDLSSPKNKELIYNRVQIRGLRIRELDWSRFEQELSIVVRILNESFPRLWKYAPFKYEEFLEFSLKFRELMFQGLWLVAEIGGDSVGFVGAFPQCSSIFKLANGELEGIDLHLISDELDQIKEGAIVLLGVLDEYGDNEIGLQLMAHLCKKMIDKGYTRTTSTWEISDREGAHQIIKKLGGQKDEIEWTIYQRGL